MHHIVFSSDSAIIEAALVQYFILNSSVNKMDPKGFRSMSFDIIGAVKNKGQVLFNLT